MNFDLMTYEIVPHKKIGAYYLNFINVFFNASKSQFNSEHGNLWTIKVFSFRFNLKEIKDHEIEICSVFVQCDHK